MSYSIGGAGLDSGPRQLMESFGEQTEGRAFNRHVIGRLLAFLRPHTRRMVVAFLMMVVTSMLTLLGPYLIKVAIDGHIALGDVEGLARIALLLLAVFVGIYGASALQQYLVSWVGQRVLATMRSLLFAHLQALHLGYHDTHIVGVTISRVINDVAVINELLSEGFLILIGDAIVLVGIVSVMLSISPRLALLTFTVFPLMLLATYLFASRAQLAFRRTRVRIAAVVGDLAEDISGMRVIQAFAQEHATRERFDEVNRANRDAHVQAMSLSFIFLPSIEFMGVLATAIVLWFGGQSVAGDELTIGVVVAFLAYVSRFFQPIRELSQLYTTLQAAMAGGERVLDLLDTQPEVADRPDATEMPLIAGRIELRQVCFAYRDEPRVLHDIDLTIEPGQTVALVGATGAGKTTIANIVARLYEVASGAVLIDGLDVRQVTQQSLRRQMALVPQEPFLFAGTIADNIRFARTEASTAAVQEAARSANAHEFIVALPQGYDTQIAEGATNLSMGQRQLICIARAVLADPRILILDEATSSVDTITEMLIQEGLKRLLAGRTAIVIAHRLTTVRDADHICVLSQGRIVERSTHAQLLAEGVVYRSLYERQFVV